MKQPIIKRKKQTLSIDWNLMTIKDLNNVLAHNEGFVDGDEKTIEIKPDIRMVKTDA